MFAKPIIVAGGAAAALLSIGYVASKARPSSTAGSNVPVDEEFYPKGYVVDRRRAHEEHLDIPGVKSRQSITPPGEFVPPVTSHVESSALAHDLDTLAEGAFTGIPTTPPSALIHPGEGGLPPLTARRGDSGVEGAREFEKLQKEWDTVKRDAKVDTSRLKNRAVEDWRAAQDTLKSDAKALKSEAKSDWEAAKAVARKEAAKLEADAERLEEKGGGFLSSLFGGRKPAVRTASTTAATGMESRIMPGNVASVEELDLQDRRSSKLEERALRERARALEEGKAAQDAAAQAAAAEAAAALLKKKEAEAAERARIEFQTARDLEDAAARARAQAKEMERLAAKEHSYAVDADRDAERKLREQERRMRDAAKFGEMSENDMAAAQEYRLRLLREKDERALEVMRRAEELARVDRERAAREAAEADEARRRAAAARAAAAPKLSAANSAEGAISVAAAKEREAQRAVEAARAALADAARRKAEAADRAARLRAEATTATAPINAAEREAAAHAAAATAAEEALRRAQEEADAASRTHEKAASLSSKLTSWWSRKGTVTATSTAEGTATAVDVVDPSAKKGTYKGTAVEASGTASVSLVDTPQAVRGGRAHAVVQTSADKDSSKSRVTMAESSRSPGPFPPGPLPVDTE